MNPRQGYLPIADYGLIGNRQTCALVARDGSIDWCCLPGLDSPSVFGAILDSSRGGRWRVAPRAIVESSRRYLGNSAVLETSYRGSHGVLRLRDFLPIREGRGNQTSQSVYAIVRSALCLEGEIELDMEWMPRPNYARDDIELAHEGGVVWARSHDETFWLAGVPPHAELSLEGAAAKARVRLAAGAGVDLVSGYGTQASGPLLAESYLEETLSWWNAWTAGCDVPEGMEKWRDAILRSGMVLKLLTNERTGAIAAAPTTSLPEEIGGVRNWDYRYCWIRDATLISRALVQLGQPGDGMALLRFLEDAAQQHHDPARVQVLYRLNGDTCLDEYELGHLDGYRDSRPIRIGNAAAIQIQNDVYGALIQAACDLVLSGEPLPASRWRWLQGVADHVCNVWRTKDRGIWEVRGPEQNFIYSKLMCWVALDRALWLASRLPTGRAQLERWEKEREAIRSAILQRGYDRKLGSFVQSFESPVLDASNLAIPLVGFLPATDPRVQGTIDATIRELTHNGLVCRYKTEETKDGVSGNEGAFGICTFWLADALALSGRIDEAREIFEAIAGLANDLGLFPEEINSRTGEFLGNFPQAFTHVGLVNSAYLLGKRL